ncbi:MAG: protein kinase [Sandaracinaceae bacterium]|nr:protein kinase [Sandaracinaceae bacterium]
MSFDDQSRSPATRTAIDEELAGIPLALGELALDSNDFERITLLDVPKIATYGNYELLGRIAYGGMAEIFLARELGGDGARRMVVVKRVLPHVAEDPHFVDMFRDEARLAMQLNHPHICHVYSFGEAEGTYYLAMEWVNGVPLSKIIRRARDHGGIPIEIAARIIAQVAEALDYAHRATDAGGEPLGIVHRDVSPQNVMVSFDGVVKLLDFGIAKATSHSTRTEAGVIKGKFAYMSPQQCVGEPIDARADIFALGICLFEAVAGKNPFRRKTEFETMTKIVGDPTPDLLMRRHDAPEALAVVTERALMKQPERRYQTAGEMQMALEQVIASRGTFVTSARLSEYVTALFPEELRDGPILDTRAGQVPSHPPSSQESIDPGPRSAPPGATPRDAMALPARSVPPPAPKKRRSGMVIALGLVVAAGLVCLLGAAGLGGGAFWMFSAREGGEPFAVSDPSATFPGTPRIDSSATPPLDTAPRSTGDVPLIDVEGAISATTGSVYIESDPPGALVSLDGRDVAGRTPLDIGLVEAGEHRVRVRLEGHHDYEGRVVVVAGRRAALTADLRRVAQSGTRPPANAPGALSLNTRPWSKVYVGRRLLGTTPIGRVEVPSGSVRLRLVDRDGQEHHRTVRVGPGEHVTESFDLRE